MNPFLFSSSKQFLHSYLPTQFPKSFDSSEVKHEWTGILGYTSTSDPLVGPLLRSFDDSQKSSIIKNQYFSGGFSGHGMTRAYSCSEILVDMIVSRESNEEWKPPNWFPLCYLTSFPGEEVEVGDLRIGTGR